MAWRLALGLACSLDQIPRTLDVARCGLRLADTEAQREFSVQHSVSEIDVAGSIARIAQRIDEVGNSGGADESHCTFMRSAPAPQMRRCLAIRYRRGSIGVFWCEGIGL